MASRGVGGPQGAIDDGRFLQYATAEVIVSFVRTHPELFFDGQWWDDTYEAISYTTSEAIEAARARVIARYSALLTDAQWLADSEPEDLKSESRERLMRAALATDMLAPDIADVQEP